MNKILIFLLLLIWPLGCCPTTHKKQILAKVNNYEITLAEFDEEFKNSPFNKDNNPESRAEFLQFLINRKLILQDAEAKGLDRNKDFLKMIGNFWEQSLLKLALEKKSREISTAISVSDAEWDINREKETAAMDDWVAKLKKQAHIQINEALLK